MAKETERDYSKDKDIAFELYMGGTAQNKIATLLNISQNTVSKWKQEEGWDDVKTAILGGGYKIVASIFRRVMKELEAKPDDFNMDFLVKAGKSVQIFMPNRKTDLQTYTKVFADFGAWLIKNGKEAELQVVVELQDEFIDSQIQEKL